MSTMSVIVVITIFFMFAVPLFTSQVYWSFLDKRIKDKKALLSVLEPAYPGAVYAVYAVMGINVVFVLVLAFTKTIEYWEIPPLAPMTLFLVYITFLSIPRILISNLKTSIEEEAKNVSKSAICNTEDVGQ